jgi:hypothetical protein
MAITVKISYKALDINFGIAQGIACYVDFANGFTMDIPSLFPLSLSIALAKSLTLTCTGELALLLAILLFMSLTMSLAMPLARPLKN